LLNINSGLLPVDYTFKKSSGGSTVANNSHRHCIF